jgi:hypothetical protein
MDQPTDQPTNPYFEQITVADSIARQVDTDISAIDQQAIDAPLPEFAAMKEHLLKAQIYARRVVEKANEKDLTAEDAGLLQAEDIRELGVNDQTVPDATEVWKPKDAPEAGTTNDPASEQPKEDDKAFDDSEDSAPANDSGNKPKDAKDAKFSDSPETK